MDAGGEVPPYLVGLRLRHRRVLVVGGGRVAARRVPRLVEAGARVDLVAPEVTPALEGLADAGRLRWLQRGYRGGDVDGAWYVLAASDSPAVNAAVADEAETARVFCVRADDGAASSAWTPAVADLPAGPGRPAARVAVSSGQPATSARIRDQVLAALAPEHGPVPEADASQAAPSGRAHRRPAGIDVALVGGGPGAGDLITVRGLRMLRAADVVVADRLAPTGLLDDLDHDVVVIDAAKLPRGRAMAQEAINAAMIEHARAGRFVVRLKGGDPYVFGRGYEELQACVAADLRVEVVPGITSALAGPALAGIPATHRGLAQEVVVVTGHVPPADERSRVDWAALARLHGTVVVLMGLANAAAIGAALVRGGRAQDTPVAVVADASHADQQVLRGRLDQLGELAARLPAHAPGLLVIGSVVGLDRRAGRHRPAT